MTPEEQKQTQNIILRYQQNKENTGDVITSFYNNLKPDLQQPIIDSARPNIFTADLKTRQNVESANIKQKERDKALKEEAKKRRESQLYDGTLTDYDKISQQRWNDKMKSEEAYKDQLMETQHMWQIDPTRNTRITRNNVLQEFNNQSNGVKAAIYGAGSTAAAGVLSGLGVGRAAGDISRSVINATKNVNSAYKTAAAAMPITTYLLGEAIDAPANYELLQDASGDFSRGEYLDGLGNLMIAAAPLSAVTNGAKKIVRVRHANRGNKAANDARRANRANGNPTGTASSVVTTSPPPPVTAASAPTVAPPPVVSRSAPVAPVAPPPVVSRSAPVASPTAIPTSVPAPWMVPPPVASSTAIPTSTSTLTRSEAKEAAREARENAKYAKNNIPPKGDPGREAAKEAAREADQAMIRANDAVPPTKFTNFFIRQGPAALFAYTGNSAHWLASHLVPGKTRFGLGNNNILPGFNTTALTNSPISYFGKGVINATKKLKAIPTNNYTGWNLAAYGLGGTGVYFAAKADDELKVDTNATKNDSNANGTQEANNERNYPESTMTREEYFKK